MDARAQVGSGTNQGTSMTHALIERLKELHAKSGSRKWEVDPDDRPNME